MMLSLGVFAGYDSTSSWLPVVKKVTGEWVIPV